jgi:Ca-activated chloride channel family protein
MRLRFNLDTTFREISELRAASIQLDQPLSLWPTTCINHEQYGVIWDPTCSLTLVRVQSSSASGRSWRWTMETQRSICTVGRTLDQSNCLWLLFAFLATLGVICKTAYAQDCAPCAVNAVVEDPVSSGEWLLTKQVNEVSVIFVALRKGKAVGELSQNDISVRDDDKAPTAILGFRTEQGLPLRVGVAIDTSSSVTSRFRFEQAAASAFFHQAVNRDNDLGFVMGFENHPTVTQDFVGDPDLLSQGVDRLTPGGGTALYDAVRAACQKLRHRPEQDMVARVLVVLSDGQNNAGEVTLERAIDAAQEAEVTIYTISTNYARYAAQQDWAADAGNSNLRQLAEQTGGRVLFPANPRGVAKAFARIEEELRSRYAVSYKPSEFTPDGHYRAIKIEARKGGDKVEIRARKGYYARAASWLNYDPAEEVRTSSLR